MYSAYNTLVALALTLGIVTSILPKGFCQGQNRYALRNSENVTVDSVGHRLYYEQRIYRNPLIGMLEVAQGVGDTTGLELVPLYQGVPIAGYRLSSGIQTRLLSWEERAVVARQVKVNWRRYKVDFRLQPEFIANFGYKEQPVLSKTNLLLQTQLYLRQGLVLNIGVLFPIINDYDNQPLNIRPAPIYLNQFLALSQEDFVSGSVGLFGSQYGVNVQYRRSNLTKPWSFGLETSLTGFYYFPPGGFYYERLRHVLVLADVAYRLKAPDVSVKVSGGQYMYNDRGVRLDLIRQFTNVEIGVYAMKTRHGSTAGFNFAIPIPPGRIVQSQRVRLRSSEEFRWEYSYNAVGNVGVRYRVGVPLDALLRQYHSGYLTNQLTAATKR